jgi:hypothetical protein
MRASNRFAAPPANVHQRISSLDWRSMTPSRKNSNSARSVSITVQVRLDQAGSGSSLHNSRFID